MKRIPSPFLLFAAALLLAAGISYSQVSLFTVLFAPQTAPAPPPESIQLHALRTELAATRHHLARCQARYRRAQDSLKHLPVGAPIQCN